MSSSYINDGTPVTDFEALTVTTVAVGITASKLSSNQTGGFVKRCVKAFFTVETQPVRVRWDGTAPTSTVGHYLAPGDSLIIQGEQNVANVQFIRDTSATASATVSGSYSFNR